MKAAHGDTFGWSSNHWSATTTLNEGDLTTDNGNSKYEPFNSMPVTAFLAVWPDDNDWEVSSHGLTSRARCPPPAAAPPRRVLAYRFR